MTTVVESENTTTNTKPAKTRTVTCHKLYDNGNLNV